MLISIVVPVYYNAASLPALHQRLTALAAAEPAYAFEFIFVDDGSGDHSYRLLTEIAAADPRVRLIKLTRNFGSNTAILAGLSHARGHAHAFIAADLQDPPETLPDLLRAWENGAKVVLAVRRDRLGDPWSTRLFAGLFNRLFERLVFPGLSPQGVGFFLIDRQVTRVLVQAEERNPHLVGLLLWTGFPHVQVPYDRRERPHGESRWTFRKKLKFFIDAFAAFSYLPLRLASALGFLLAFLGGLYALLVIALRLFGAIPIPGWTALMVVVLILSGVQLLILGILGEYLWRTLDASRRRPLFVIEEIIENVSQQPLT